MAKEITKVSEITVTEVASYLRITDSLIKSETKYLNTLIEVAKDFIKTYTGLEDLDKNKDLIIVVFVLIQDMYDNRSLYVDKTNLNKVICSILDGHSINLL